MLQTAQLDLFAGIPVADYAAVRLWYERLLGSPPSFFPNDNEAVWRGPYEDREAAEKEGLVLGAEIDDLDDEGLRRFIAQKGLPPTRH